MADDEAVPAKKPNILVMWGDDTASPMNFSTEPP
jgi:hypothetical protein